MYRGEGRGGVGAAGDYHDYNGGYLPELAPEFRVLKAQEGLQTEPVVVYSQAEHIAASQRPPAEPNQQFGS